MSWQVAGYETDADKPFDQGSFGTVWHARRKADGTRVALKLVLREHAPDAGERIEAERRGALLQRAFHDAHGMVPAIYDIGEDADGDLFIAMEYIAGGSLTEAIARGPLPPLEAAAHATAICRFLEKAHRFTTVIEGEQYDRLVHADLKPGHIFVRPSGDVIVLDFGIAKALGRATPLTTNNWGTSAYMSPERLIDGRVDEHVDFWSLGVILYEMLAGHRPYRGWQSPGHKSQLERAIRGNAPREPLPDAVPPGLAAVVGTLLAYQPERRYRDATSIREDLERVRSGEAPRSLAAYDTPATIRVGLPEDRDDGSDRLQPTMSVDVLPDQVPATDPLPFLPPPLPLVQPPPTSSVPAAAGPSVPVPLTQGTATGAGSVVADGTARTRRGRRRRLLRVAALLAGLYAVTSEVAACAGAERFRDVIPAIDGASLSTARESYARIAETGPLDLGLSWRVDGRLRSHLLGLADRVIEDYRNEQPALTLADWKHAQEAVQWAEQLSPDDRSTRARLQICEAHILRISMRPGRSATTQATYRRAIDRFRAAARLDTASFDPYLGISRVAVYGLLPADVEMASEAMAEAQKRGYQPGRRERALLGDGHLRRGETLRREARNVSGPQRRRALEQARDSFAACVEAFEPILGFGNASRNVESCKAQAVVIDEELAATAPPTPEAS